MDPLAITFIVNALAAGAGAIASSQAIANEGVQEVYQSLKALLQRKFAGTPDALLVLAKYEEKPTVWRAPLKEELTEVRADQDEEILKTAYNLMVLVKPKLQAAYVHSAIINTQYKQLEQAYKEKLYHIRQRLGLCLGFAALGFLLLLLGAITLLTGYAFVGRGFSVGAIVSIIFALLCFLRAREADKDVNDSFKNLLEEVKKRWASELTLIVGEDTQNRHQEAMMQQLLDLIAKNYISV